MIWKARFRERKAAAGDVADQQLPDLDFTRGRFKSSRRVTSAQQLCQLTRAD
jgi:hypothetical protein